MDTERYAIVCARGVKGRAESIVRDVCRRVLLNVQHATEAARETLSHVVRFVEGTARSIVNNAKGRAG